MEGGLSVIRLFAGRIAMRRIFGGMAIAESLFGYGKLYNPPCPPLKKGGNYKELLLKSPFGKGG